MRILHLGPNDRFVGNQLQDAGGCETTNEEILVKKNAEGTQFGRPSGIWIVLVTMRGSHSNRQHRSSLQNAGQRQHEKNIAAFRTDR